MLTKCTCRRRRVWTRGGHAGERVICINTAWKINVHNDLGRVLDSDETGGHDFAHGRARWPRSVGRAIDGATPRARATPFVAIAVVKI